MKIATPTITPRIPIVDALRGFALVGIILLHAIEHFDLLLYPEKSTAFLAKLDSIVSDIVLFIFAGKAYSIFSILFGLSFYLQMKNQAARGVDYQWRRFSWRLLILFVMGYLLSLLYIGEILTAFAMLGLLLLALNRLSNKWLIIISFLFLIQFPTLFIVRLSFTIPDFTYQQDWSAWQDVFSTFSKGSFLDVIRLNSWKGHLAKWQYFYNAGRYLQLIGLFTIGLLLGRMKYFENLKQHVSFTKKTVLFSGLLFISLYVASFFIDKSFTPSQAILIKALCESYSNLFFTLLLMSLFILISIEWNIENKPTWLSSYGKMSLTNYVMQPLIGVPFFYGFGLGMYAYFGITYSFLFGLLFLSFQLSFSSWWLKHHTQGPLEKGWRQLTNWGK
ncbi:MAG: hypothetical protein JWO58_688 [Chitinophagaceae bacterium]|nr:hypothetical protein [Chitinophagaceae bacterium]